MRKTPLHLALLAAPCLILPAPAQAQTQAPAKDNNRAAAGQPAHAAVSVTDFVRRAAIGNMFEIELSTMAAQQSESPQVKQFAQRMVQDHTQARERLKGTASKQHQLPADLDEQHAQLMQSLRKARGPAFDRRYVQAQVEAHKDAVDLYDGFARSGSDATLKQFATELLPTLRQHLQMAETLQSALPPDRVGAAETGSADGRQGTQGQGGSSIVVQQTAPLVMVDQGSPQVTVRQAQPDVSVRQPRPQITIRQPQPTITIDMPQPEIIVRMPKPDVNVAMAQPQVEVQQPQPRVQVVQPQKQAQVDVERGQPQVRVLQPQGAPAVNVQQAQEQPEVRFERTEPKVVVNDAKGEPQVRFEPAENAQPNQRTASNGQQAAAAAPAGPPNGTSVPAPHPAGQQQAQNTQAQPGQQESAALSAADLRDRINAGDAQATGTVAASSAQSRAMTVQRLEDMDVYNAKGEDLGEVDRVIVDGKGGKFLVVGNGGFLGIGRDRVAFPMDRFWIRGDRLVIRGVTENDIEAMDDYRDQFDTMRRLPGGDQAKLRIWQ